MRFLASRYGIDAPHVVRTLFLLAMLVSWGVVLFIPSIGSGVIAWLLWAYAALSGAVLCAAGIWMVYCSCILKPRIVSALIQRMELCGNERVLDLGCGRGILLCALAKAFPEGEVHGLDLWNEKDQSGNTEQAARSNVKKEGIYDRVRLHTGDIRGLPFPQGYFDAVTSGLCIHNIQDEAGRKLALDEMLRVLKPGGTFAIYDIQYGSSYVAYLKERCLTVSCTKPFRSYFPPLMLIEGKR